MYQCRKCKTVVTAPELPDGARIIRVRCSECGGNCKAIIDGSGKGKQTTPAFADLHRLPEDLRIDMIGKTVIEQQKVASIFVDDEPDKPERYMRKLQEKFAVEVERLQTSPVKDTVVLIVRPKKG